MQERIALYGGAFDPPHNGHLACISLLLNSGRVDRVLVVPSGDRPDKPEATAAVHRIKMTQLAVATEFSGDSRVAVSDMQTSGRVGFGTIDVVEYLHSEKPDAELLVVIGPELIGDLPRWKASEALRRNASFLIIPRPGVSGSFELEGWKLECLVAPHVGGVDVSSPVLRRILGKGSACGGLLPRDVVAYCKAHALYR